MKSKYKHLVDRREFLNLPGRWANGSITAYVEDTSDYTINLRDSGTVDWRNGRIMLKMTDCGNEINLEFDLSTAEERQNSFYKIDMLLDALSDFRAGLVEESVNVKRRERAARRLEEKAKEVKKPNSAEKFAAKTREGFFESLGIDPETTDAKKLTIEEAEALLGLD